MCWGRESIGACIPQAEEKSKTVDALSEVAIVYSVLSELLMVKDVRPVFHTPVCIFGQYFKLVMIEE